MCGIAGFLVLNQNSSPLSPSDNKRHLENMTRSLLHRGPDDEGFFLSDPVYLGMRRLQIIDVATGKQPISNEDGTVTVVFNGEIYNFVELREELVKKGHVFKTHSDTEVLVHLYEEEGVTFPRRLRGMFAFALWDGKKQELFLCRDHFGVKPLFYGSFKGNFVFGSELKALFKHPSVHRTLDSRAIDDFLTLLFIPAPHSAFRGLFKLEPGTALVLDMNGNMKKHNYWNPVQRYLEKSQNEIKRLPDALAQLDEKISECVKLVLRSDVPLGVFLSSGLDSAAIAYYAKKNQSDIQTFTIFYDDNSYSEKEGADQIARHLSTKHTEIPMDTPKDLPGFVWSVLSHFDEPFGDLSTLPTYLLCQSVRPYITVALSGDGGDELFGGYPTTWATRMFEIYRWLPPLIRRQVIPFLVNRIPTSFDRVSNDYVLKRFVNGSVDLTSGDQAHLSWRGAFYWQERARFFSSSFMNDIQNRSPYEDALCQDDEWRRIDVSNRSMLADLRVVMPDQYLVKADMVSMAHSLELRPALLDPELAELAFQIPAQFKLHGFKTKYIIRKLMETKLPKGILEMPKKGFTPPLSYWLKEKRFQDFIRDCCQTQRFRESNILKRDAVSILLKEHAEGQRDNTRRLWAILSLATVLEKS